MKKFLSLLLAMTMVMSLIVLPARATETTDLSWTEPTMTAPTETTAARGTTLTFTVSEPSVTKNSSPATKGTDYEISYAWSGLPDGVTFSTQNPNQATGTVTGIAGSYTVKCTVTVTAKGDATGGPLTKELSKPITISDAVLDSDVTTVSFNGRSYAKNAVLYSTNSNNDETTLLGNKDKWIIAGYTVNSATNSSGTVTLNVSRTSGSSTVSGNITVRATAVTATGNIIVSPSDNHRAGQPLTFSLPDTVNNQSSTYASFSWLIKKDAADLKTGTSKTLAWTPTEDGTYTVTCVVKEGGKEVGTLTLNSLVIAKENYRAEVIAPTAASKQLNGSSVPYSFSFKDYTNSSSPTNINLSSTDITWTATGGGATFTTRIVKGGDGTAANTLTLGNTAGNVTVTATFTYLGKNYTVNFPTVTNVVPSTTLTSINCGGSRAYSAADVKGLAETALVASGLGITSLTTAIRSVSVGVGSTSSVYAYTNPTTGAVTLSANSAYLGQPTLTATVTRTDGSTYTMNIVVPVIPIYSQTFEAQYPQAVSAVGNTYNYTVTPPTGYDRIALITKGTAPTTAQLTTMPAYNSTSITLNSSDFNSTTGKCTLYVMAWNSNWTSNYYSTGKYYYGPLEVYQQNHDIKYNGVVGNTVQFKHNDFTTFMNEMYGTNTTSYLTFNSVKFTSVPNATTQGTLYYNGVAMTTGYGSNYFNTSTAVTNLDNVSFSVSSRVPSTSKEIRIPFTLYATRYNSYGTSAGTSVTYSGVVVISLVREDVTFTVAPGDSVRFTDSAFLTYLRSASGINYNYNIDYVTFDQSAVNALNEGVLYAYSTGFNAVKTTDRFYYTTTSYNQNALSDVTFRASTYAKTGTTVYIPFTITAKYGTSSATRQVTGTVAVKIAQTMNFVDVKTSDYFYDSVKWAVNNNITKGTSAVTFSPNNTCTRAEIVTFLWRAAGSPTPTITRNPFTDVKYAVGSDFYNAILWASQNGITAGKTATTFAPNDNCTRAQIVTFLWRYAKKPLGYYTNPFNDVNKTEYAAYYDAILWAAGKGIATGNTPKTFDPDGTCTRAEAVTFLYRYESTK